jgi:hypothetical protein
MYGKPLRSYALEGHLTVEGWLGLGALGLTMLSGGIATTLWETLLRGRRIP